MSCAAADPFWLEMACIGLGIVVGAIAGALWAQESQ
jgi:hypothetical protein